MDKVTAKQIAQERFNKLSNAEKRVFFLAFAERQASV